MNYVIVMVAFLAALGLPANRAAAADCTGMAAKIAAAKTASDHQAIAACYMEMAKESRPGFCTPSREAFAPASTGSSAPTTWSPRGMI